MTSIDAGPPRLGVSIALGLAAISVVLAGSGSEASFAVGGLAFGFLLGGLFVGRLGLLTAGTVFLVLAHLVRVGTGGGLELSILGTVFAVAAWDVGEHAHDLGTYVGREARSGRAILTHATLSVLVGIVPVGLGYVAFALAPGGRPVSALVLLLLAGLLLTVGLDR